MFNLAKTSVPTKQAPVTVATLICQPLLDAGFIHGFSTRRGGTSPLPSNDLNLAFQDDMDENVKENRKRFLRSIRAGEMDVRTMKQTHSDQYVSISSKEAFPVSEKEVDSLQTNHTGILIGVKTADCLPILLGDPKTGWMAAIHAGWRGTLKRITEKTLIHLFHQNKVDPKDCLAVMGPFASAEEYEVGSDVYDAFCQEFEQGPAFFQKNPRSNKFHLDTAKANRMQLLYAGLEKKQIFQAPYCTMKQNDLFFSYRKEGRRPMGRMLSVIGRR